MKQQSKGYITIGLLFLIAGLVMLLAEYSTDTGLDVPDVYAGSELSDTTAVSSTCSPTGNQFSAPTNISYLVVLATSSGGVAAGTPTATVAGGVGCAGCTAETESVVVGSGLSSFSESTDTFYNLFANGARLNRNVQCLGISTPYSELQMSVTAGGGINNVSVENAANSSTLASFTALSTTLAYVLGSSGTANAISVDSQISEIVYGGATNMLTGFGYSIAIQRDVSIDVATTPADLTQNIQLELSSTQ